MAGIGSRRRSAESMAMPDAVFVDTDVLLDHLADRMPFAEFAHRLFGLAEAGGVKLCVCSLSFTNLHYILRNGERPGRCARLAPKAQDAGGSPARGGCGDYRGPGFAVRGDTMRGVALVTQGVALG